MTYRRLGALVASAAVAVNAIGGATAAEIFWLGAALGILWALIRRVKA